MCRMLGVMCNDGDLLECAVTDVRESLRGDKLEKHEGIGVGYYGNDEPLLKKRPAAEGEIDYQDLIGGINSNVLLIHIRHATVGAWKDVNTHPFRFRNWLFTHLGHLPGLESNREKVTAEMPPFLTRDIRGETDSELAFHIFLDVLFKDSKLNDISIGAEELAGHLKTSMEIIDKFHTGSPQKPKSAMLLSNGQIMAAVCRGVSMHYSHREGILECKRHENTEQNQQLPRRFRGIMLGAEMSDPGHQWREVADASLLSISKELELKVQQL
ncbi:class II glutamine amidotransferase [Myxococcota bacterium]